MQPSSGFQPASYSKCTGRSFFGGKWPFVPFSATVDNKWRFATTPPTRLHGPRKETLPLLWQWTQHLVNENFGHLATRHMNTISKVRWVSMVHDFMLDEPNCVHYITGDFFVFAITSSTELGSSQLSNQWAADLLKRR
jgi:hypothetical protein